MSNNMEIAIIGGGIVGLATAWTLSRSFSVRVTVLEGESEIARHQTGNNSGVIHSGLYYKPGSLKARNCTRGYSLLLDFCREHGIAHEICGKIVVATREDELTSLKTLEERGLANGLSGIRRLNPGEMKDIEPNVAGVAGLWVPQTGIIDFKDVAATLAELIPIRGGQIITGFRVKNVVRKGGEAVLMSSDGKEHHAKFIINCGGLQSDRIARMCGIDPGVRIIPFRGEYYQLRASSTQLVRNLIYPVPDPRFPFLGVHFTRMVHGGVEAGPNAVLAFRREGYNRLSFSPRDTLEMAGYAGFWRMAGKYWKTGMGEVHRSFSKAAFVRALQRLLPSLKESDLAPGGAGVRAQAVTPDGSLVDDFRIETSEGMIHVLNAPSPAATSSLSIGETIAGLAGKQFGLKAHNT
ncbi:MAG TPA: L-2-hydroxyglutarate oxidase [Kiritimatiellia bacterium]|nr:L-2-hydroxyglutarate oxidase [Kiritimatiellia bacterium]